eukprot:499417-Amorphochlora_amoeboformis.AAC.1
MRDQEMENDASSNIEERVKRRERRKVRLKGGKGKGKRGWIKRGGRASHDNEREKKERIVGGRRTSRRETSPRTKSNRNVYLPLSLTAISSGRDLLRSISNSSALSITRCPWRSGKHVGTEYAQYVI